jgi:1-acyl-sn-glycerol-3-phosphate acyltransferase
MKKEIRKIPFVGKACESAGHILIDRSSPVKAQKSIIKAKEKLSKGACIVVFPEGTRTKDGSVGRFKKGAFSIAADLQLPVVPITIKGAYEVLPYNKMYVKPGIIEMKIHKPIDTTNITHDNLIEVMELSHNAVSQGLNH